ncbi:MAG: DUF4249 domain-containing protein [Saprospiraceae bacterium]|nr:DUF4249 domain-containing protein [Saprospiraceae bacterium]
MSCVDEVNIQTSQAVRTLVVEGFITTEPGPHTVKISTSAKYGTIFEDFSKRESKATVRIRDNEGRVTFLTESEDAGVYLTPTDFHAELGKSYTLLINTLRQGDYASIPEETAKVPPIDSLQVFYRKTPTENTLIDQHSVEIYATWMDPPEEQNFYTWQNKGTYFIETFPENFTISTTSGKVPAPKPCCKNCWVTELNSDKTIRLFSDRNYDGKSITQLAANIVDDGGRFMDKYLVRIRQLGLSKNAFTFLDVLKRQLGVSGGIFDPPPAELRGNIVNLDDPDNTAIGYFFASEVQTDSIFIDGTVLQGKAPSRQINDDCRILEGSTTIRPSYW